MSVSDKDYIKKFEPLWKNWYIDQFVGEGSYGKVYKIYKEEWGYKYESALKLISVPTKEQYREAEAALESNDETLHGYFEDAVKNIVNEIRMMYTLRGNSNVIAYEDHLVEKRQDEIGWDILIRMEFATPLPKLLTERQLSREELITLGIEISSALEVCGKKDIIHRDIKDENIFVSSDGIFKLGDFGISRQLSNSGRAASMRGTPLYMAPEVFKGERYDTRTDIYSLGIVLYKLFNYGRLPFMPPYPEEVKYRDSEAALDKRILGETPPIPLQANKELGDIILKASSYNPDDRYSSALELRSALQAVLSNMTTDERKEIITLLKGRTKAIKPQIETTSPKTASDTVLLSNNEDTCLLQHSSAAPTELLNNSSISETVAMDEASLSEEPFNQSLSKTVSIFGAIPTSNNFSNQKGNSSGNIVNGGLAAAQGFWVYYSNMGNGFSLSKIKFDESEKQLISSDNTWFINVVGYWIYYSNGSDGEKLYKLNIDGTGKTKLNDDKSWDINVVDDWIYYSNESDGYKIYKIKTDGSCRIKLNNDKSYKINVEGDWIYYCNKSNKGRIYKIHTDGSNKSKLNDEDSDFLNVTNNWIYYSNNSDNYKLYKMRTDGSGKVKLSEDISKNINVANGWIYYSNKSDGGKLYRIGLNGESKTKINDDNTDYISAVGDWVYYCNKSNGSKLYRSLADGRQRVEILGEGIINPAAEEWILL